MIYRKIKNHSVSTLCFGTATFVAGKLRPNANSKIGISALNRAIDKGLNFIHSNPKLKTQWATKKVLDKKSPFYKIHHAIKIETPLGEERTKIKNIFTRRLNSSMKNLGVKFISTIIYEIDVKRTHNRNLLHNVKNIKSNFTFIREIFEKARRDNKTGLLFCMTHSPLEMRLAINAECFDGLASYFNLIDIWPSYFFDEIYNKSKNFIGIRPLRHGILTDAFLKSEVYKENPFICFLNKLQKEGIWTGALQSFAIRFVLAHPVVKSTIVGMSTSEHVDELIAAASRSISVEDFRKIVDKISGHFKDVDIRS